MHSGDDLRELGELHSQYSAANLIQPAAVSPQAQIGIAQVQAPLLISGETQIVTCKGPVVEPPVVGGHAPSLTGGHVFVHLEAEGCDIAERSYPLAVDASPGALGAIFQQKQFPALRHLPDCLHIGGGPAPWYPAEFTRPGGVPGFQQIWAVA